MRKARDEAKSDLADQKQKTQTEVEEERGKRRQMETQVDKLKFEINCKIEETAKEVRNREEMGVEVQKLKETI